MKKKRWKENTHQGTCNCAGTGRLLSAERKTPAVSAIEARQAGVSVIIVPNKPDGNPHFRVVRVRKGDEIGTLSYRLPEKYEAESAAGEEEETQERRAPEQLAINAFAITSDAPVPAQTAANPQTGKQTR